MTPRATNSKSHISFAERMDRPDSLRRARSPTSTSTSNKKIFAPAPEHYVWAPPLTPDEVPRTVMSSRPPLERPPLERQDSSVSSRTSQNPLSDKFAQLRDAAFYASDLPGFLLSADETLCYPHVYAGVVPEEPVELTDVDAYFLEVWALWDEDFTRKLIPMEYPAVHLSRHRKAFQGMRCGVVRGDRRIVLECRGQPLYAAGSTEFIGGICYVAELGDVEEVRRKKREEQFRSFETICDSLPHIVWSSDEMGNIDYFSRAWYEFTGLTEQESMGHGWRSAMHADDEAESWQNLDLAKRTPGQVDSHYRCRRRDGQYRWVHARASPRLDEAGNVARWYGTITDVHDAITTKEEARKLERENQRLLSMEHAARESSRMKSQFLANMSHELRTPIAGITGMVGLLRDTTLDVEQVDYADCIKTSASNLLTIVNDVLDFSKIESGKLQIEQITFDLTALVDDFRRVWTLMASQKSLQFRADTNLSGRLDVSGDPTRIGQILSNLCSNALKFTSDGEIRLTAHIEEQSSGLVVQIVVEDTGAGMSERTVSSLFTPFRQGDASTARLYGGTGLGLTISRNLAQLMGGGLILESKLDVGTRAILTLPLKRSIAPPRFEASRAPTTTRSVSESMSNQSASLTPNITPTKPGSARRPTARRVHTTIDVVTPRKQSIGDRSPLTAIPDQSVNDNMLPQEMRKEIMVLIVEDNLINQRIALKTVQKLGFSATAADNGKEALDWVKSNPVDIILMDCQMPLIDGYEATCAIRTQEPYISLPLKPSLHRQMLPPNPTLTNPFFSSTATASPRPNNSGLQSQSTLGTSNSQTQTQTLKDIPIIALTASAIPGDQAKCFDAGMSDYITKPLDSRILEMKLIRWVVGGGSVIRRRGSAIDGIDGASDERDGEPVGLGVVQEPHGADGEHMEIQDPNRMEDVGEDDEALQEDGDEDSEGDAMRLSI